MARTAKKAAKVEERYCIKCKKATPAKEVQSTYFKNGVPAVTGVCTVCNSKIVNIVKGNRQTTTV